MATKKWKKIVTTDDINVENVLEGVQVNGVDLTPDINKKVNIVNDYLMKETIIDCRTLNQDSWYPVTFQLNTVYITLIEILLRQTDTVLSWSTHNQRTYVASHKKIEMLGSGWGSNDTSSYPIVRASDCRWVSTDPIQKLGQIIQTSLGYVYVRGGGRYIFRLSGNITPVLHTTDYLVGQGQPYEQTLAVLTSVPNALINVTIANKSDINNGVLSLQKNGVSLGTFSANQSTNNTINITVPTKLSELTDDVVSGKYLPAEPDNNIISIDTLDYNRRGCFCVSNANNSQYYEIGRGVVNLWGNSRFYAHLRVSMISSTAFKSVYELEISGACAGNSSYNVLTPVMSIREYTHSSQNVFEFYFKDTRTNTEFPATRKFEWILYFKPVYAYTSVYTEMIEHCFADFGQVYGNNRTQTNFSLWKGSNYPQTARQNPQTLVTDYTLAQNDILLPFNKLGDTMLGDLNLGSNSLIVATASSSWTNSDRSIPFGVSDQPSKIRFYKSDFTYNPNTGALKAGSFVKKGGTSAQFLKADGSVDSNTYISNSIFDNNITILQNQITDNATRIEEVQQSIPNVPTRLSQLINDTNFITDGNYLPLTGGTMTGLLRTSWNNAVAIGSKELSSNTTLINAIEIARYSNGCMGSVYLSEAYGSITAGWYNYIYIPHRHGGNESDNPDHGNLILLSMTGGTNRGFVVRCSSGGVAGYYSLIPRSIQVENLNPTLNYGEQSIRIANIDGVGISVNMPQAQHYITGITAGASGTNANSATTNGNTFIKVNDNNTYRSQVKIVGTGGTTVTSDGTGVISINSANGGSGGNVTVVDSNPTLAWGQTNQVGTVGGTALRVTMPANPNTDTKVTSVANHYTPAQNTASNLPMTIGDCTFISQIHRDARGHVVGATLTDVNFTSYGVDVTLETSTNVMSDAATSSPTSVTPLNVLKFLLRMAEYCNANSYKKYCNGFIRKVSLSNGNSTTTLVFNNGFEQHTISTANPIYFDFYCDDVQKFLDSNGNNVDAHATLYASTPQPYYYPKLITLDWKSADKRQVWGVFDPDTRCTGQKSSVISYDDLDMFANEICSILSNQVNTEVALNTSGEAKLDVFSIKSTSSRRLKITLLGVKNSVKLFISNYIIDLNGSDLREVTIMLNFDGSGRFIDCSIS